MPSVQTKGSHLNAIRDQNARRHGRFNLAIVGRRGLQRTISRG
jgi:hypothetical protein